MTSLPQARRFDWTNLGLRIASGFVLVPTALYATLGQHQHWVPALQGRQEALPYLLLISVGVALLAIEWGGMSAPGAPVRVSAAVTAAETRIGDRGALIPPHSIASRATPTEISNR